MRYIDSVQRSIINKLSLQSAVNPLMQYLIAGYRLNGNSNDIKNLVNGSDSNINYTTGKYGQAASFNGSTSLISLGNPNSLNLLPGTEYTITVWVKRSGNGYIISKAPTSLGSTIQFSLSYNNQLIGIVGGLSNNTGVTIDTEWNHISLINKFEVNVYRFFVFLNGVSLGSANSGATVANDTDVLIGARRNLAPNSGSGFNFNGLIDELYIFNKALTQQEIQLAMLGL
jgi:hypothetical protein